MAQNHLKFQHTAKQTTDLPKVVTAWSAADVKTEIPFLVRSQVS